MRGGDASRSTDAISAKLCCAPTTVLSTGAHFFLYAWCCVLSSAKFLDTGLILTTRAASVGRESRLVEVSRLGLAALSPFSYGLWLLVFVTALFAGVVFWLLENRGPDDRGEKKRKFASDLQMKEPYGLSFKGFYRNFGRTVYLALTGITGVAVHTPVTVNGQASAWDM